MKIYVESKSSDDAESISMRASELAGKYNLDLCEGPCRDEELHLNLTEEGLLLCKGDLVLMPDLSSDAGRLKQSNLEHELLVKAAKPKALGECPTLLDATAGLGEDSLILAAAGFHVSLYECDPVIAALLEDAIRRAGEGPLVSLIARMDFHYGDSIAAMRSLVEAPDVILLDPMFPARNKSALIKKKFQLLHEIEAPCCNEEDLFTAAAGACPKKILVKRPAKGPYLAGRKPDYSIGGKAVRYDCYVNLTNRKNENTDNKEIKK